MRVVVLDGEGRHLPRVGEPRGEVRAEEVRMEVVRDRPRRDLEHGDEVRDGGRTTCSRRVVEVADVLREEGLGAADRAGGALEYAAEGDDRLRGSAGGGGAGAGGGPCRTAGRRVPGRRGRGRRVPGRRVPGPARGIGKPDRRRRVAAGAADECRPIRRDRGAHDAVVAAHARCRGRGPGSASAMPASRCTASALPVTSGSPPGLALVITSTSSAALARATRCPPAVPRPRGTAGTAAACTGASRPARRVPAPRRAARASAPARFCSSTIGRSRDSSSARFGRRRRRPARQTRRRSATITANGFSSRVLARAQRGHRRGVARVADEVEAAQPLDRDDLAAQRAARPSRRSASTPSDRSRHSRSSSASGGPQAGQALGSAWNRRSAGARILGEAGGALRETRHAASSRGRRAARA